MTLGTVLDVHMTVMMAALAARMTRVAQTESQKLESQADGEQIQEHSCLESEHLVIACMEDLQ